MDRHPRRCLLAGRMLYAEMDHTYSLPCGASFGSVAQQTGICWAMDANTNRRADKRDKTQSRFPFCLFSPDRHCQRGNFHWHWKLRGWSKMLPTDVPRCAQCYHVRWRCEEILSCQHGRRRRRRSEGMQKLWRICRRRLRHHRKTTNEYSLTARWDFLRRALKGHDPM